MGYPLGINLALGEQALGVPKQRVYHEHLCSQRLIAPKILGASLHDFWEGKKSLLLEGLI